MRLIWLAILAVCFSFSATAEQRLALVIHQQDYSGELSDVTLAPKEAQQMVSALEAVGFAVSTGANLTKAELDETLDDFRVELELAGSNAIGFIYYTGHGAQDPRTGTSYLLGVNTKLRVSSDFARYGINLKDQRDAFGATGAKAVFMVFDACRNTPAIEGFKASMKGLNRVEASPEMLIAYSTSLGDLAQEGVYAPILAEEIRQGGQSAEQAFLNAQKRVARETGNAQKPWSDFLLYSDVYFAGEVQPTEPSRAGGIDQETADAAYSLGDDAYYAENYSVAYRQYKVACDGGNALGCNDVGYIYSNGLGLLEDDAEARKYYKRACDMGRALGCKNFATLLNNGHGGAENDQLARTYYTIACDGGNADACSSLADLYEAGDGGSQDSAIARLFTEKACTLGSSEGCFQLGRIYKNGDLVAQDIEKANEFYTMACEGGNASGCTNLGLMYEEEDSIGQDYTQARGFYKRGCEGGSHVGCSYLGDLTYRGLGGDADQAAGIDLVRNGCANDHEWACSWLDNRDLAYQ